MTALIANTAGATTLLATNAAFAQGGNMMDGGMWGTGWMAGRGGPWAAILIVLVVVGLVAWVVKQQRK
jgi:hypothetical protein